MTVLKGPETFSQQNENVMAEGGKKALPPTFQEYMDSRLGFLSYLEAKLDGVRPFIDTTQTTAYEKSLAQIKEYTVALKELDYRRRHSR